MAWLKRTEEWIKANPKKGTMYKVEDIINEPKESLTVIRRVELERHKKRNEPKLLDDSGIYVIVCEQSKRAYVGQSQSMGVRMRSHKSNILSTANTGNNVLYTKMKADLNTYGAGCFQFMKYIPLPGAETPVLIDVEAKTMIEFMDKGYSLYNTVIPGNIYCVDHIRPFIIQIIKAIENNPALIDKIKDLL